MSSLAEIKICNFKESEPINAASGAFGEYARGERGQKIVNCAVSPMSAEP